MQRLRAENDELRAKVRKLSSGDVPQPLHTFETDVLISALAEARPSPRRVPLGAFFVWTKGVLDGYSSTRVSLWDSLMFGRLAMGFANVRAGTRVLTAAPRDTVVAWAARAQREPARVGAQYLRAEAQRRRHGGRHAPRQRGVQGRAVCARARAPRPR